LEYAIRQIVSKAVVSDEIVDPSPLRKKQFEGCRAISSLGCWNKSRRPAKSQAHSSVPELLGRI